MKTFLALGDSYTIGEGVPSAESWPVQLATALRVRGVEIADPQIIAQTGWTTDELAVAIAKARSAGELKASYDLISLLIGVNNQYRGRPLEEYRVQFRDLLDQAIVLAARYSGHVLVLSIPDWGVTPFGLGRNCLKIAAEIDQFNRLNRRETLRAGARYLNITQLSRRFADDPRMLAADGLHPSGQQYAAWVQWILAEAIKILMPLAA